MRKLWEIECEIVEGKQSNRLHETLRRYVASSRLVYSVLLYAKCHGDGLPGAFDPYAVAGFAGSAEAFGPVNDHRPRSD